MYDSGLAEKSGIPFLGSNKLLGLWRYWIVSKSERDCTPAQIFVENDADCEAVTSLRIVNIRDDKGIPSLTSNLSGLRGRKSEPLGDTLVRNCLASTKFEKNPIT